MADVFASVCACALSPIHFPTDFVHKKIKNPKKMHLKEKHATPTKTASLYVSAAY